MSDFFALHGITDEARISIILNTFMYIDSCGRGERAQTLGSIISEMSYTGREEFQQAALSIMKKTLSRPENNDVAELRLISYSENMGSRYTGAYAAVFGKADGSEMYVVYRGTGCGRWYDNGDGLANTFSDYQLTALRYFNDIIDAEKPGAGVKIIVTGHSKGGNLAQYVTFMSGRRDRITKCISFDGQGFSPEFMNNLPYSQSTFNMIKKKMYSICGYNDYVNVLGIKAIEDDHTIYIVTKADWKDMYGAHSIVPEKFCDADCKCDDFIFNFTSNTFNEQTQNQNILARCSQELSRNAMELPQEKREDICRTLMTFAEKYIGGSGLPNGLKDERASLDETISFLFNLYELVIPLTSYVGKNAAQDIVYRVMIGGDDPSLASAPVEKKIQVIMEDPDMLSIYYLGVTIAIENCIDSSTQTEKTLGDLSSAQLMQELDFVVNSHMLSVKWLMSYIERLKGLSVIIKGLIKLCIENLIRLKEELVPQDNDAQTSAESFGYRIKDGKHLYEGTEEPDKIECGEEDDIVYGRGGDDVLHGHGGKDEIYGGPGRDIIYGAGGNDRLYGEGGNDTIYGGDDDDKIYGGSGDDTLIGGRGNDAYVFVRGFGNDNIIDNEGDNIIELRGYSPGELVVTSSGDDVTIAVSGTSDSVKISDYRRFADRFTFVFSGGSRYRLMNNCGSYGFVSV
ncbi:Mbeg1-like protein [Ruminococcus flavefaciens]|uniref:Uncharacterized protein n=1 Tax=Ruminococcus flavefaciens 007c TaxID=1341157 RepID=W7UN08_RUMFL|nr:Mbeg1-like protein [Ruminococcus flavefaciens]EWM55158.1 hypothetical protein RF007C_05645 [Ruminococcus flavefaciens 007c]